MSPHGGYREIVYLPAWASLVLATTFVVSAAIYLMLRSAVAEAAPGMAWAWDLIWVSNALLLLLIPVFLGRLVLVLEGGALVARFGFVSIGAKSISLTSIERAEPVLYRPIREFGGWGIRVGKHAGAATAAYSMRGNTGVLLTLKQPIRAVFRDTDRVLIGSLRPDDLAAAIEHATS